MMEKKTTKEVDWRVEASNRPEYYLDSEEGRRELSEMIRTEAENLLQQIMKQRQRTKDIIWLSSHCYECYFYGEERRRRMKCERFGCQIVKPFYGRPLWVTVVSSTGQGELLVSEIDWSTTSMNISELVVEETIRQINNGLPYSCFEPRL